MLARAPPTSSPPTSEVPCCAVPVPTPEAIFLPQLALLHFPAPSFPWYHRDLSIFSQGTQKCQDRKRPWRKPAAGEARGTVRERRGLPVAVGTTPGAVRTVALSGFPVGLSPGAHRASCSFAHPVGLSPFPVTLHPPLTSFRGHPPAPITHPRPLHSSVRACVQTAKAHAARSARSCVRGAGPALPSRAHGLV